MFFFLECAPGYPFHDSCGPELAETHTLYSIVTGPEYFGRPEKRLRLLGVGLNRQTTRWVGPESQEEIRRDFEQRFYKGCQVSGAVHFRASMQEREKELKQFMRKRGLWFSPAELAAFTHMEKIEMALTPCTFDRLKDWLALKSTTQSAGGTQIINLNRFAEVSQGGATWPVLTCQSQIAAVDEHNNVKLATALEHLASLGFHTHPVSDGSFGRFAQSPVCRAIEAMNPRQAQSLIGNGMSLITQSAWIMYVLGNTISIRGLSDLPPRMKKARTFVELDEEDSK